MDKTYVIGDIHGCHDALYKLLDQVNPEPDQDTLVFLGDYIDRGKQSCQVIDLMLDIEQIFPRCITLMGNHEHMFLDFIKGRRHDSYLKMGGHATLESYGLAIPEKGEDIREQIPERHRIFLENLLLLWEDQHGIYVHAGISPSRHLSQQRTYWCLWGHESFLSGNHSFPKPVVYGHTTLAEPQLDDYKIGIDTGAVYGGELTCLCLPDRTWQSVDGPPMPGGDGVEDVVASRKSAAARP
ncbi:MAG: metallophosphoesterase family protein [Thermodesulfobacteriota bacterium]